VSPLFKQIPSVLLLSFVIFLAACDSSSRDTQDQTANPQQKIPIPTPIGTPPSQTALEPGEKEVMLAANGQPVDAVIVAMETIIEKRAFRGETISIKTLAAAIDGVLEIHCQNICDIKERGQ